MIRYCTNVIRYSQLIAVALFFTLLSACTLSGNKAQENSREVTDLAGRKVVVPKAITRVYVNRPGAVLLYSLAPDLMVNRPLWITDGAQNYLTTAYQQLPYTEGSVEEIIKLHPDIIIYSGNINAKTKDDADKLSEKSGIPVYMISMDMASYEKNFTALGTLLNRTEQSARMSQFLHTYFDSIAVKAKQIPQAKRVRVYYAEGTRGLNTDPSGSFHSQIIDLVGAHNVADVGITPGQGMSAVSMEQLLLWNPDVVLVWTGMGGSMTTMQAIKNDPLWAKVRAVQEKKLYQIPYLPFGWFDRPPATNRILGAIWTAQLLYPDIYRYDLQSVTKEFFEIFYHHKLSDAELQTLLHPTVTAQTSFPASRKTTNPL